MKRIVVILAAVMASTSVLRAQITRIRPTPKNPSTAAANPATNDRVQATMGSQSFSVNFEKIVLAYRNNFHSIQGESIPSENEKMVFHSTMTVPGTLHAVIYRFHSRQDTSASWQAVMYTGADQKKAMKMYKSICRQVNKFRVGGIGIFKGNFDEPDPNLRFAGTTYKLETEDKMYNHFYAEVDLVMNSDEEWEVYLSLVRKKEDDERF